MVILLLNVLKDLFLLFLLLYLSFTVQDNTKRMVLLLIRQTP